MQTHERLREIVKSSGMKSVDFGKMMGVSISVQRNYEAGRTRPDTAYLERMMEEDFDVIYLLTGKRSVELLSAEDSELLTLWHRADLTLRHAALNVLATGQAQSVINQIGNITHSVIIGGINQQQTGD